MCMFHRKEQHLLKQAENWGFAMIGRCKFLNRNWSKSPYFESLWAWKCPKQSYKNSRWTNQKKKKKGILGIQQGLEAAQNMLHINVPKPFNMLKYLLMHKLSQDHLEHLFSRIRAPNKIGFNTNPTSRLFQVAYKAQLLHAEVKISTGNRCLI